MFYVSKASPWPQTPRGLLFTTDSVTHFAPVSFPFPNPFPSFAYRTPLAFDFRAPVIASNCLSSLSERHSPHCTASPSDLDVYKALSNPFSFSAFRAMRCRFRWRSPPGCVCDILICLRSRVHPFSRVYRLPPPISSPSHFLSLRSLSPFLYFLSFLLNPKLEGT